MENVLLLGHPKLRKICEKVEKLDLKNQKFKDEIEKLQKTLILFRIQHGFGRGIAGLLKRCVALCLDEKVFVMYNPEITWRSTEKRTMYDDCMSFPHLKVKVERNESISVKYFDENFNEVILEKLPFEKSELLQHEFDHLDGILCIDRVLPGKDSIVYTKMYEKFFKK